MLANIKQQLLSCLVNFFITMYKLIQCGRQSLPDFRIASTSCVKASCRWRVSGGCCWALVASCLSCSSSSSFPVLSFETPKVIEAPMRTSISLSGSVHRFMRNVAFRYKRKFRHSPLVWSVFMAVQQLVGILASTSPPAIAFLWWRDDLPTLTW